VGVGDCGRKGELGGLHVFTLYERTHTHTICRIIIEEQSTFAYYFISLSQTYIISFFLFSIQNFSVVLAKELKRMCSARIYLPPTIVREKEK
jgi:hypothetical protein